MQKSFLLLSASFRTPSSSSAMRFGPFMAKLQCRAFEGNRGFGLPFSLSPFGGHSGGYRYRQFSQLRLKKVRESSDGSKLVTQLRPLSLYHLTPKSSLSFWHFNSASVRNPCDNVGFAKRSFSQLSAVNKGNENESGGGGGVRQFKNKKRFAAHSKRRSIDSSVLASNDVDGAALLGEQMAGDVKLESSVSNSPVGRNNKQKSKANVRQKKRTTSKQTEEQTSGTTIASEQAAVAKSPRSASRAKKSVASKNDQSAAEVNEGQSVGNVPNKASTKLQANKKSANFSDKGKYLKAVNESEEKQKPPKMGELKSSAQCTFKPLYPPTGKSVVVVESVTKANVIQGYLGDMFEVLPSYGHVRDLAPRSGSVRPDEDFSMLWEVPSASWTHLKSIKVALSGAENLILASDPDREGEAIAWHIFEMLQQQDALHEGITVARVVFHEITESSIKGALQAPREINGNLVHAYLARRALDYLIGFNISPLLWRKLPGCQSAGRVQSAALSLICDREMEIDKFKPQEYWTIGVGLKKEEPGSLVNAHLTHFDSKKLNQLSISSQTEAKHIEQAINSANFVIVGSKTNKMQRKPPTPYITSTLQQDAANKLNFNATYTMKLAQKLYEGVQLSDGKAKGLITYLRTDGLHISDEAVKDIRSLILERYGSDFASGTARKYFKKVKNAQEAHEAIRPTDVRMIPSMLAEALDGDSLKLYTLIWARTLACQMEPATIEQIQVDVANAGESIVFRSSSSRVEFLGYQAVYEDAEARAIKQKENEASDNQEPFGFLKSLKPGDPLYLDEVELKQHFTQPPARYSEGSLVKKLEELGIGRPSTYASTLKVLQDRNYVTVKSRVLHPEFRGRMVSAFLSHHFSEVTDYSFTADMESELDNVSSGITEWKGLLKDYWTRFSSYCTRAQTVQIRQLEKMLEKTFSDFLFSSIQDKTCPSCMEGNLTFKVSRFGAGYFIGCDQHPKCKYIAKTLYGDDDDDDEEETRPKNPNMEQPKLLGLDPVSKQKILLRSGPYGSYVQLGENKKGHSSPKRTSVSHIKDVKSITLEDAIKLFQYPITLGNHPKDGHPVILRITKTGFGIKHRSTNAPVPKNLNPDNITMEKALKLLSSDGVTHCGRPKSKPKKLEAFEAI